MSSALKASRLRDMSSRGVSTGSHLPCPIVGDYCPVFAHRSHYDRAATHRVPPRPVTRNAQINNNRGNFLGRRSPL